MTDPETAGGRRVERHSASPEVRVSRAPVWRGIGFGLLGKVAYHHIWALSVAFYLLQVLFSAWWMARYHYGPAEWLWRQLSYGRRFGIRRAAGNTP